MSINQLIFISIISIAAIGCSNTVHVNGKVTLEDGTPVTKGTINFNNEGYEARGIIKPDGTYQVATTASGQGLQKGNYRVFFSGTQNVDEKLKPIPIIDQRYDSVDTTDLTISIQGKTNFSPKLKPHKK
ncbi:MAG: hypothetical protein LBC74_04440 [Planctomycetaceae bacterium]|jgi:hypothetical protein|nr:hypothetical protein [Planctomycetaceae bacterium]